MACSPPRIVGYGASAPPVHAVPQLDCTSTYTNIFMKNKTNKKKKRKRRKKKRRKRENEKGILRNESLES
jgi:hypothetical protein